MEYVSKPEMCRRFFRGNAKPILRKYFPDLEYSAGVLGKGYEEMERGRVKGPYFYLIIKQKDVKYRNEILKRFTEGFPSYYLGYPVKFSEDIKLNNWDYIPEYLGMGNAKPLVYIRTLEELIYEELGVYSLNLDSVDWITLPEYRLRNLAKVELFEDNLKIIYELAKIVYYPEDVRKYLIASQWDIIARERAYLNEREDEIDSVLLCSKIVERLMRLCFLYCEEYAPKNDRLGAEFRKLDIDYETKNALHRVLIAETSDEREELLEQAQKLVANIHNRRHILSQKVELDVITRDGKRIRVAKARKFAEATRKSLWGSVYENVPLIGSLSQIDGPSLMTENHLYYKSIRRLYF